MGGQIQRDGEGCGLSDSYLMGSFGLSETCLRIQANAFSWPLSFAQIQGGLWVCLRQMGTIIDMTAAVTPQEQEWKITGCAAGRHPKDSLKQNKQLMVT